MTLVNFCDFLPPFVELSPISENNHEHQPQDARDQQQGPKSHTLTFRRATTPVQLRETGLRPPPSVCFFTKELGRLPEKAIPTTPPRPPSRLRFRHSYPRWRHRCTVS